MREHLGMRREWRTKVTMNDYIVARMKRAGAFDIDQGLAYLMGVPVDRERATLRERVPIADKSLPRRIRKFLTLGAVYAERETFAKRRHVLPTYQQWLTSQGISAADAKREAERARQEWAAIRASQQ